MRESRGKQVTFDEFKTMTQFSTIYDEEGRSYTDKDHYYHLNSDGEIRDDYFDEMIRDPVYMLLKYHGSFKKMISSPYFIDNMQHNQFYYKSSSKVPFYMVYECCPNI